MEYESNLYSKKLSVNTYCGLLPFLLYLMGHYDKLKCSIATNINKSLDIIHVSIELEIDICDGKLLFYL